MAGADVLWFGGSPGASWRNNTQDRAWQFVASPLPCLRCLYHDRLIVLGADPGPLHPHCRCERVPIGPGERALYAFKDFRLALASRPDLVGKERRTQLRRGQISWARVVQDLAAQAR